jgi:hypothetical protein
MRTRERGAKLSRFFVGMMKEEKMTNKSPKRPKETQNLQKIFWHKGAHVW